MSHIPAYRTDEELLEGLRQAAPGALEAFLDRYADLVHSLIAKVTGDRAAAKTLLREAIVKTLASLDGIKSAKTLERQVLREACALLQGPGGESDVRLEELLPEMKGGSSVNVADWSLDPGEDERRSEERRVLRELVAAMPRQYALILVLHDMEECPLQMLVETLQLPTQTVKERLHLARLHLRKALTKRLGAATAGREGSVS